MHPLTASFNLVPYTTLFRSNAKTRAFWSDTAKPRLNEDANVVVMFHRYTESDIAGWLMEQEPDEWELIRYAAEDRKSTRLNSSHSQISYAVFCLKKKKAHTS